MNLSGRRKTTNVTSISGLTSVSNGITIEIQHHRNTNTMH